MTAEIIDGKLIANALKEELTIKIEKLKQEKNIQPCLAVILVGENPASEVYVRNKERACEKCGVKSLKFTMSVEVSQEELIDKIQELNNDSNVHGILVQLPLPKHIDEKIVMREIDPNKDVDGFHVVNVGKLSIGEIKGKNAAFIPCTPKGCVKLIKTAIGDNLSGKKVTIVGRSNIVGKPMAQLMLAENCTVKVTHSRTQDLKQECLWADILIAAVGKPKMITKDMVKPGAVVIDVGINRTEDGLVGDVDFEGAMEVASHVTPVPGGVGRMTIACLIENLLQSCLKQF